MYRVVLMVVVCLLVLTSLASAIDKRFVISWKNNPENVVGTVKEVAVWWVSWQINPNQSNNYDYRNLDTVPADPTRAFGNHEVEQFNLNEGDAFHVAIQGCSALGKCSDWSPDAVVLVPPELAPGEPDPDQPGAPQPVYIMMHPLQ